MSQDRIVQFQERRPARGEIHGVLEDYIGEGGVVRDGGDSLHVTLAGRPSHPLRRQVGVSPVALHIHDDLVARCFEVYLNTLAETPPRIYVMTRNADEFTSNIANGFVQLAARWWKGELVE